MSQWHDQEWVDEKLWVEVEHDELYLPEAVTKIDGAKNLISSFDAAGKDVVDVGCGTGWFGELFQQRGARVIGTDISPTLLAQASKRIKTVKASADELPFPNEQFDAACFFMVAHVLEEPGLALHEISRILKTDGKLFFAIVSPDAEIWDEKTKLCSSNKQLLNQEKERVWVFNLKDGRSFTKHYFHRPLPYYHHLFAEFFQLERELQPSFISQTFPEGMYAEHEYYFAELVKKRLK